LLQGDNATIFPPMIKRTRQAILPFYRMSRDWRAFLTNGLGEEAFGRNTLITLSGENSCFWWLIASVRPSTSLKGNYPWWSRRSSTRC